MKRLGERAEGIKPHSEYANRQPWYTGPRSGYINPSAGYPRPGHPQGVSLLYTGRGLSAAPDAGHSPAAYSRDTPCGCPEYGYPGRECPGRRHSTSAFRLSLHRSLAFFAILLLLLTACSNGAAYSTTSAPPTLSKRATAKPNSTRTPVPVVQQSLPKALLKPGYPVLDWVFSITCNQAINSFDGSSMNAALAYDSAAWLYPSDGHLVVGGQSCDQTALIQQAKKQGLSVLITVGIDSSWSDLAEAQYIDQAASQQQEPCTVQATTYICNIVNWAVAGGYTGVIIDFEIVKRDYPNIRQKFATFMQELQNALHQKGLLCGIALIHRIGNSQQSDPSYYGNSFEDWKLLSELDFLIVMVVDQDLSEGKPGPLVSTPWVDQQLNYIWQTIPQILSKTIFEFPLYGREWVQDAQRKWQHVDDQTCPQINAQKASYPLLKSDSTDSTTPEFAWNDASGHRHKIWYNTNASLIAIMTQLQFQARTLLNDPHYKLPTSFWYRGAECSGFFGAGNALERFYNS